MRIDVFTIFPEMIGDYVGRSILGRASDAGLLEVNARDLRAATSDVHRTVDDSPFGGGAGMVLMPDPIFAAVEAAGLVNSDFPVAMNIQRFCPRFRVLAHSDRIFTGTTLALAITLVDTEEDVVLIKL